MATLLFDVDDFRAQFPGLFPDPPNTDELIEVFWGAAICYVSPDTEGALSADCRRQVLNLVTAHLITLSESAQAGNQPGFVVSASIDKISVTVQAPPSKTAFQFFLHQTPFGVQAYALLYAHGAGGSYHGGFNELGSFRRAGGVFSPPSTAETTTGEVLCPSLLAPPLAPYTIDFGDLTAPASITQSISILGSCAVFSAEFDAVFDDDITISIWSGLVLDSGGRFNLYYWDSDARVVGGSATSISLNLDPTGLTILDGFVLSGLKAGNAVDNPNLVVITGVDNADTQVLNLDIDSA